MSRIVIGGPVEDSKASLRIMGDDLEPPTITELVGCDPTKSHRKGDTRKSRDKLINERIGLWLLESDLPRTAAIEGKVRDILAKVSADTTVWQGLATKFRCALWISIFLEDLNHGFSLDAALVQEIAAHGWHLDFDIYSP